MSDPYIMVVAPGAVDAYLGLDPRERAWLFSELSHSGDEVLLWSLSESIDAPHDLWALHRWDEARQTMTISSLGHFPAHGPRAPSAEEERWDNEGGAPSAYLAG